MVLPKKTAVKTSSEKPIKKKEAEDSVKTTAPRSPGRTKSPGRSKSPGRPKIPGRPKSPSRTKIDTASSGPEASSASEKSTRRKSVDLSKSPTRTSNRTGHLTPTRRSPIRSSPSRLVKEKEKIKESSIPILSKKTKLIETDSDSDTADDKIEIKEKPKAAIRGRTRIDLIEKVEKEPSVESSTSQVSKRITRSQQKEVERIVHLRHFETVSKKLSEFSDEDELVTETAIQTKISKPNYDYGGPVGVAFLLLFIPSLGFFLNNGCDEHSCTFNKMSKNLNKFSNLSSFFNLKASLGYVSYISFVAILCALPFGGRKITGLPDKHGKFVYVTNGLFAAVLTLLNVVLMEYRGIPVVKFALDHQFQLYMTSFLIGVLLSLFAYVRSFYVPVSALNPHIIDKNKLYNFFMGRELHPRIFRILDLKMFVYKLLLITELLITSAWVYKSFLATENLEFPNEELTKRLLQLQPTLVVFCFLRFIHIFDGLVFESRWITSKEIQQEGFGYMMGVSYLIYPFLSLYTIKYVGEHNVQLAPWKLALIALTSLVGHFISRSSNNQKDAFRKNPYSPSFSHLETIPTTQGKKLLSSGFWGFVRHPNYLGNIIIELSMVPFVLCAIPVFLRYLNILFLIYRAKRDNSHCKQKYGAAWDRYCNRVRYLLVPKVY